MLTIIYTILQNFNSKTTVLKSKVVGSIPAAIYAGNFTTKDCKKSTTHSQSGNNNVHMTIDIIIGLQWDSYKGVGCASTKPESILHEISEDLKLKLDFLTN